MRTILALVKKEIRQLKGDPFYLRFLLFAPVLQLIILGFSLTIETRNVSTMIFDGENSAASRELVRSISTNDRFTIVGSAGSYDELLKGIHRWKASIGIYIPPDFSDGLQGDEGGKVLVLLDAVDGNKALTAFGYLQQIAAETGLRLSPVRKSRQDSLPPDMTVHYFFNPELKNEAFMVPGIVVVIISIITLMIGAMNLVREKEKGTLEQLAVTPIHKGQLILGKVIPFLIYSFIEVAILLKLAQTVFHLHLAGSILQLYAVVLLYLFSTLGLGLLASTLAGTQQQALFIAWFFMIFMILLSGFFIPVENMPQWLQQITRLNPTRYMMTVVREIYLKATPLRFLMDQLIPLAGLGGGIFGVSVLLFRKTVK